MFHSFRAIFALISAGCIALLAYGYYLQYFQHLEPCPMCIFQRICYFGIAVCAAVAVIHHPGRTASRVYSCIVAILALTGAGIAARQTWLQHLPPDKVPECGPGLDFMLEMYSFSEAILNVLRGTGECAVVDWRFLTLSIAEWSVICFLGILCLIVLHLIKGSVPHRN